VILCQLPPLPLPACVCLCVCVCVCVCGVCVVCVCVCEYIYTYIYIYIYIISKANLYYMDTYDRADLQDTQNLGEVDFVPQMTFKCKALDMIEIMKEIINYFKI
jgi:hypothetical protein